MEREGHLVIIINRIKIEGVGRCPTVTGDMQIRTSLNVYPAVKMVRSPTTQQNDYVLLRLRIRCWNSFKEPTEMI